MSIDEGISIEIVWDDGDLKMIVLDAANGRFRAHAEAYGKPGELARIADAIDGFPLGQKDVRHAWWGRRGCASSAARRPWGTPWWK